MDSGKKCPQRSQNTLREHLACVYSPTLPPALSHSALVMALKPWPLHTAWPLQAFSAVLQSFMPLQDVTP